MKQFYLCLNELLYENVCFVSLFNKKIIQSEKKFYTLKHISKHLQSQGRLVFGIDDCILCYVLDTLNAYCYILKK